MKSKTIFYKIAWVLAALLLTLLVCFQNIPTRAYAAESQKEYSSVMDDLGKDESFEKTDYPANGKDYSLKVITISESENKELFVYVHQPSAVAIKFEATSINISQDVNALKFTNYKLRLIDQQGVFQKYVMNDYTVSSSATRNYYISSIFRKWSEVYDSDLEPTNENTINEVAFEVAKVFTFEDKDGNTSISVQDVETIKVENKYVGFVRYQSPFNGLMGLTNYYDSHFVAFSTDRKIDKLLEADVYYEYQEYHYEQREFITLRNELTDPVKKYAYLTDEQKGNYTEDNLFWKTEYEWYRISTVEDFIKTEDRDNVYTVGFILETQEQSKISEEGLQDLAGKQWVLRFTETNYHREFTSARTKFDFALISNVNVLRLKFETDGKVYNLGVVDNKQTGGDEPDNDYTFGGFSLREEYRRLIAIILMLLLFFVLYPILTPIVRLVCSVLILPFKLLGSLFKKKEPRQTNNRKKR